MREVTLGPLAFACLYSWAIRLALARCRSGLASRHAREAIAVQALHLCARRSLVPLLRGHSETGLAVWQPLQNLDVQWESAIVCAPIADGGQGAPAVLPAPRGFRYFNIRVYP